MKSILILSISCALAALVAADFAEQSTNNRIINGAVAGANQFPWHAQIAGFQRNGMQTLCGGALVSQTHVLTAAHCVISNDFEYFRVGLGAINRTRPLVNFEVNPYDFNARLISPLYNPGTFANDIALLRLPFAVNQLFPNLAPIRLQQLSQANNMFVNSITVISGFGRINDQSLVPSVTLQFARVRIITQAQCGQTFGTAVANANTLCTLGQNFNAQGPCANDNGGPLILEENTGNTLVGIHSFMSTAGCNVGHPAGFARLGPHLQWISNNAGVPIRN